VLRLPFRREGSIQCSCFPVRALSCAFVDTGSGIAPSFAIIYSFTEISADFVASSDILSLRTMFCADPLSAEELGKIEEFQVLDAWAECWRGSRKQRGLVFYLYHTKAM